MKKFFIIFYISIASFSCSLSPSWDIDGVAPVIQTRLDLSSLIGSSYIQSHPDSSLKIVFEDTLYALNIDSLSDNIIVDETSEVKWNLPTVTIQNFDPLYNISSITIPFDLGDARVEEVLINEGKLNIEVKSIVKRGFKFRYHTNKIAKNGIPFSYEGYVSASNGSDTSYFSAQLDMSGYQLNMKPYENGVFNTLKISTDIEFDSTGGPFMVTSNQLLFKASTRIDALKLYSIKGYLGKYNFDLDNSSFDLDILKKFKEGTIDVDHIEANLDFINFIGADAQLFINYLKATNSRTGVSLSLVNQHVQNMLNINRAVNTNNPSTPIIPTITSINLNSGNSNINQLLHFLPDQFQLKANVKLNPQGNSSGYNDFYYPDYPTYIYGKIVAPLKFSINQVVFVDTMTNPFMDFELGKNFLEGSLHAMVINKFPLEASAKIYLVENGSIIDSLYSNTNIQAAPVDQFNKVTQAVSSPVVFNLSESAFENLRKSEEMILKVHFETKPNSTLLQMYSDYFMDVKITSNIKFRVQL